MCFVEKVKEPYEISSMLVQTLGFRAKCDIAALHFPRGKFTKARAKPLITGLPPSSPVLFLFALWAHVMLCSLLFKSAMLLRAALYLYITVGPSCVTAPIRVHRFSMEWQTEPVPVSEERSFFFGTEMCHFLLFWVQWAYPDQRWQWSLRTGQSARSEISFGITLWLYASWNIISVK